MTLLKRKFNYIDESGIVRIGFENFLECNHWGFLSIHLSKEGKSQCTKCANELRFSFGAVRKEK